MVSAAIEEGMHYVALEGRGLDNYLRRCLGQIDPLLAGNSPR